MKTLVAALMIALSLVSTDVSLDVTAHDGGVRRRAALTLTV